MQTYSDPTMHSPTRNPSCCPACAALAAWNRAVAAYRISLEYNEYAPLANAYSRSAAVAQYLMANANCGASIDILRVETPATVAYGYGCHHPPVSVGMSYGYRNPENPAENWYVPDLMRAALDSVKAH